MSNALNDIQLVNAVSLQFIKTLPENSIDLIMTDPPYYRVKDNAWDREWESEADFLAWLDECLAEFWRALKPEGSLYLFSGHELAAKTELLVRDRMQLLNHIIWAKPSGRWNGCRKEELRGYFPTTERILFAEHYGAEGYAKGLAGYASKCAEVKEQVFTPLIEYFRSARATLGISAKEINAAAGKQMCSHWFSHSQWQLPSQYQYEQLQALFTHKAREKNIANPLAGDHLGLTEQYSALQVEYSELRRNYNELRQQDESLRRPFSVTSAVPYTDVWSYPPVQYYPGKHPCEKPTAMLVDIINASSRPGDIIADFFMGSGATIRAAAKLGRRPIGVELEE